MRSILWAITFCMAASIFFKAYGQETSCTLYQENNGLVVIEMEDLPLSEEWTIDSVVSGYTGEGYIVWKGDQFFNAVGRGPIQFQVKINTPGIYRFNWRVAVGKGTDFTEHNDTWLKMEGSNFYCTKTESQVQPVPNCRRSSDFGCPNGSSTMGFFKIYGGAVNRFRWQANTSDNDPHNINVQYDTAGIYSIDLRARSSFQCIDRMVLYKIDDVRSIDAESTNQSGFQCADVISNNENIKEQSLDISIFPNPAKNLLHFKHQLSGKLEINIHAMDGTLHKSYEVYSENFTAEITSLPPGMYVVKTQMDNRRRSKIINVNK